ncbi:SusC/RagA family TonB-linked outer membrane protein [Echinicola salinicaeni]|uniref:SusC/RagA family TonB-linked outer membrane protein n=1 Tax=Echinicola salinicaeni TaxID=2762757 RepID=UPI0016492CA5|nr:TonB-dependent receptor [Echinicola salinicaeni]
MKKLFTLIAFFMVSITFAQNVTITGTVTDGESGEPLPGANILVKGQASGTVTDMDGKYSLSVAEDATLIFSFIGYTSQEVKVGSNSVIDVALSGSSLEEVVVVGYGTQKKKNLTGAVGTLSTEDIGSQSVTSAANALSGRVSGVQLIQGSAQPGNDAPTIQIRGVGTVRTSVANQNNDSAPLVLVDGVQSTLNDVHPNDIESFSVLKDAASAAIYGARAANGVILVTTKRGKSGKPKVSINSYMAFQNATTTPDMLSPYDFARLKNEAQTNIGQPEVYSQEELDLLQNGGDSRYSTKGLFEQGYRTGAPLQNHYFSVTGGTEYVKYMFSAGYQDQEGVVIETDSKRYNFRSNVDVKISDKVRTGINISGSLTDSNEPNYSGYGVTQLVRDMIRKAPLNPLRYDNGYISAGNAVLSGRTDGGIHPIGLAKYGGNNNTKYYRATPNLYFELEPIKDMVFRANGSVYVQDRKQSFFRSKMTVSDGESIFNANGLGEYRETDLLSTTSTFELTGRYTKTLGKSTLGGMLGYTSQAYRQDFLSASNEGYNNSILTELDVASLNPSVAGNASEWALESYFGRVNYDYEGKYLAEFNIRYDGSSRFGENNRFGTFPSFSLGWNMAKEDFMSGLQDINELKLRGSWGQLGNQNIGNYPSIATINLDQPYVFGNSLVGGAAARALANPNVKWETTQTSDIGLDATLFDYKLSLTADYYVRKSLDVLLSPPVVATLGNLAPPVQNQGEVENRGYEFSLNYYGSIGSEFEYSISGNWSHNDNKVLKLDEEFLSANKVLTKEGYPINSFYGHIITGIFQSDAEAQDAETYGAQPGGSLVSAGDYIYEDTNGDGVVDSDDRVIIGDPNIRNTFGMTLTADYKGFNFRVLFQGVLGRDVENGVYGTDGLRGYSNLTTAFLDRWTPENTDTDIPRVATGYKYNNSLFVGPAISAAILDASYLRMKHIELGYTLPTETISKFGLSNARVYISGQNLLTFTKFVDGFDPEDAVTFNNVNDSYPQAKSFTMGVNLSF